MIRQVIIAIVFVFGVAFTTAQSNAVDAVFEGLNEWRISEGLSPLTVNETLTAMAAEQADYIASLPVIPAGGDIHQDAENRNPRQRSQEVRFAYPPYGPDYRAMVTEIAAIGSVTSAFRFWQSSETHRNSALNPAYREVGIAAVSRGTDTLFIVVFGAQPNVLPAIVDEAGEQIYLANENVIYQDPAWVTTITQYQIFDEVGRPLTDGWQTWEPVIDWPDAESDTVYILYTDGENQAMAAVSRVTQEAVVMITPTATFTPTASPTMAPDVFRTTVPTTTPSPVPSRTPSPAPTATDTPPPPVALIIDYDRNGLTITTDEQTGVDVSGVSLLGDNGRAVTLAAWARNMVALDLTRFRSGICLQAYPWDQSPPPVPSNCGRLLAVLTVSPDGAFWRSGTFMVQKNGEIIGTCDSADTTCRVPIPAD